MGTKARRQVAGRVYRKVKRTGKRAPQIVQRGAKRFLPRPARTYSFSLKADATPEALVIEIPGAMSKSFALLPGEPSPGYGSVSASMAYSRELGGKYLYVNGPHTTVELARPATRSQDATIEFTVTLVKWRRDPRLKFPRTLACRSSALGNSGIRVAGQLTLATEKPGRKK